MHFGGIASVRETEMRPGDASGLPNPGEIRTSDMPRSAKILMK
jgi:hypothetical protein